MSYEHGPLRSGHEVAAEKAERRARTFADGAGASRLVSSIVKLDPKLAIRAGLEEYLPGMRGLSPQQVSDRLETGAAELERLSQSAQGQAVNERSSAAREAARFPTEQ